MQELEVHDLLNFTTDEIVELLESRGFEEHDEINYFHKGYAQTHDYYETTKEDMHPDDHEEMMFEMTDMLEYARGVDGVNDDVTIDNRTETHMAAHAAKIKIERKKLEMEA